MSQQGTDNKFKMPPLVLEGDLDAWDDDGWRIAVGDRPLGDELLKWWGVSAGMDIAEGPRRVRITVERFWDGEQGDDSLGSDPMQAETLLRQLVSDPDAGQREDGWDPGDRGCMYCGSTWVVTHDHTEDCPIQKARRLLGIEESPHD